MSYSKSGRRPAEAASKSSHSHVVNDASVKAFLDQCNLPPTSDLVALPKDSMFEVPTDIALPFKNIVAIDGGYTEVQVRPGFPSSSLAFFQFGALIFSLHDLENLSNAAFIDPDDMSQLRRIQRFKLTLPMRGMSLKGCASLTDSVRKSLHTFFLDDNGDGSLYYSLKWLLFNEYIKQSADTYSLSSCPSCSGRNIPISGTGLNSEFCTKCTECGAVIYLIDVLRLHEVIDDELGAGGIMGYETTSVEQLLLVHFIRVVLNTKPDLLGKMLFLKDGPLAFFGQTANLHRPMRRLLNYLNEEHAIYIVGLEKGGAFVEHASEISQLVPLSTALILTNEYIYKYILPGTAASNVAYGCTTYYSGKVIFKDSGSYLYVATVPTYEPRAHLKQTDFINLVPILQALRLLHCDMYDNALVPIALVNKLVSLANHPSARILEKFARDGIRA